MCTQTIPLPEIRRVRSGEIRDEWKRMTNSQRKFSFDYKISETIKSKNIQKVQKISSTKNSVNNVTKQRMCSEIRGKSNSDRIARIALKESRAEPMVGDNQTFLNGSQFLEFVNKTLYSDWNQSTNEMIKINLKKIELQKLLRLKCLSYIRDECLKHLIESNSLIKDLKEMYFEDNYKLNVIKSNKSDDKRKQKVIESFVKTCSSRINFCNEIDQKSSSWISLTTNANRLMDVTHIRPNNEGLELVLQNTVKKLKLLRIYSISLLRIIFEINIESITYFIDSFPLESISQMCISVDNFNKLFVCKRIKALDLISIVSLRQAKVSTNKFLYYLYNEINKNFELIYKNDNQMKNFLGNLESEEITSDYYSVSSNSTVFYRKNKTNFDSKLSKDSKIVFNILIQSNQRILLKIIFGYQDKIGQLANKSPGYRQKWFKVSDASHEIQQRICRELDKQFWQTFWRQFDDLMTSSLCFCDTKCISVPISVLCNPSKAQVIHTLLKAFIRSEELLEEANKSLEFSYLNLRLRLSFYNFSQNYTKILRYINKSILTIEKRKSNNRNGTVLGLSLIDCIEPLIEVRINFKGNLNAFEIVLHNIVVNILNLFTTFVESKQSIELDHKILEYIAVSILDINNLIEMLANIDYKPLNETIKTLKNIKDNAFIKSKKYYFNKSYEMISKSIPIRDYRKKICSTNSDWIENIIGVVLQPITTLLSGDSSFESNIILSTLIDEFSKGFLKTLFRDKKIKIKFSGSGALQFDKDVNTLFDWILLNDIQSTDFSSINRLKEFSFSLLNKNVSVSVPITRNNRINPELNTIQSNQNNYLPDSEQRSQSKFLGCLSICI